MGYQLTVPTPEGPTKVIDVEFINEEWYLLVQNATGFETDSTGQFKRNQFGVGNWPIALPRNEAETVLATAPTFGDFLAQGMTNQETNQNPQINMGGGPLPKTRKNNDTDDNGGGGLKGKTPEIFDGDRSKSKAFTTDLKIYLQLNRNKADVTNRYSRVLLALSFIKGPNVVSWVDTQFNLLDQDLAQLCEGDEMDNDLWTEFEKRFNWAFISSTIKENAYIKMQNLKMKGDQLDEYVAEHSTLIAELDWDLDSEMSCHSF